MQSGEIVVSISCITYNHAPYIRQCLDGFMMQQTNFAFEVLIHDDASTDGTTEIIKEYETKYPDIIKPIYEEENQWVKGRRGSAVFNFHRAKGKYIAMCEGDDYWTDPLKLQKQVDFLEKNCDYSMCFHKAKILNEDKLFTMINCNEIEQREYTAEELFSHWIVPTASLLYRKEVNEVPIKNENAILNGDLFLVLKSFRLGKVMAFNDEMSVYRIHRGGVMASPLMSRQRALRYPKHLLCIKRNFGDLLDVKQLNKQISLSFWDSREICGNKICGLFYKFMAFCYDPIAVIDRYVYKNQ